jgi:hypothetical protein
MHWFTFENWASQHSFRTTARRRAALATSATGETDQPWFANLQNTKHRGQPTSYLTGAYGVLIFPFRPAQEVPTDEDPSLGPHPRVLFGS